MRKFNPEKIVSFCTYRKFTIEAPFHIYKKKGDIEKKEIKLFGFVIRKERRYDRDWFDYFYSLSFLDKEELNEVYDNRFDEYFEEKDGKFYYSPHIRFKMVNNDYHTVYFSSEEEMFDYIVNFKNNYNVELKNFIDSNGND